MGRCLLNTAIITYTHPLFLTKS